MTAFKKYLGYRLKSSFLATVSFSLIALLITITTASEGVSHFEYDMNGRTGIESLATIMGIIASLIPILETVDFKNRRNLDTLYFLPLSRVKLALVHYVSGLIQVFVIYTVAFIGHFMVLWKYAHHFRLQYLPAYYVLLLLLGVAIYSIFIFLFGEANSTADGVICSVMWIFALYLLALVAIIPIREYVYYYVYGGDPENLGDGYFKFTRELNNFTTWFIPYAPINNLTVVFQSLMEGWENYNGNELYLPSVAEAVNQNFKQWYMAFLPVIAGAASTWGYFRTFARKGAEKVGEASDTWFGYKVLIPIYGFSCYVFTGVFGVTFFLIAAGMYLAYAIYRKRFKIQKADIFSIVGTAAAAFIFMLVSSLVFRG